MPWPEPPEGPQPPEGMLLSPEPWVEGMPLEPEPWVEGQEVEGIEVEGIEVEASPLILIATTEAARRA